MSQPQRLKAVFVATVLGAALLEGTVLAQKHHVRTGKDAFLHYQVDSTDELIAALKSDPQLRRNYAKHFGIPEDQVIDFIKRTLVPYHLPEGRSVTTYGVTRSGHIYPVHTYLKKGTLVWATRSGLPILKWACANPLTKHIPGSLLSALPKPAFHATTRAPRLASIPANELPIPNPGVPAVSIAAPALTPPAAIATSSLTLPPVLLGSGAATIPAVASLPLPAVSSGGHGSSLLPIIPILVGIGTVLNHGGGSSSPTIVPTPAPSGPTVIPTPKPSGPTTVLPTPSPGGPVTVIPTPTPAPIPTPSPTGPTTVIPTPSPSVPVNTVPTPKPSGSTPIPTPTPTIPVYSPTPPPYVAPAGPTPTPPPTHVITPPGGGGGKAAPEPGSSALMVLAGLPVFGYALRRRNAAKSAAARNGAA